MISFALDSGADVFELFLNNVGVVSPVGDAAHGVTGWNQG
jgi:hypothetical protein